MNGQTRSQRRIKHKTKMKDYKMLKFKQQLDQRRAVERAEVDGDSIRVIRDQSWK